MYEPHKQPLSLGRLYQYTTISKNDQVAAINDIPLKFFDGGQHRRRYELPYRISDFSKTAGSAAP